MAEGAFSHWERGESRQPLSTVANVMLCQWYPRDAMGTNQYGIFWGQGSLHPQT